MAEYVTIAALDAVLNGVEVQMPETYVPLEDATTGFDGPGSYHIQLVAGSGISGGPSYVVTWGLAPSDSPSAMTVWRTVLTPTGEFVHSDARKLNVGNTGVNATIAQTPFSDGSYLETGVVTERTLSTSFTSKLTHGTSFPVSPIDGQLFFRTDLLQEFVYLASSPGPNWFPTGSLAQLNDVDISSPTNGQVLTYDGGSSKWKNAAGGGGGGGSGFSASALLTALLALTPTILYEFSETSGSTLTDHSGNGNDGTYQSPSTTQLAVYGAFSDKTAAYFDGANSYATLPIGLSTSTWTLILIVRLMPTDNNFPNILADGHTTSSDDGITIGSSNGTPPAAMSLAVRNGSGLAQAGSMAATVFQGRSYMFAASYDGSNIKLYADGILSGSASLSGAYVNGPDPVNIGRNPAYGSSEYGGIYDLFALFNGTVLTQAQLLTLYSKMGPR